MNVNFSINDLANNCSTMYMWLEGEASRGSQEFGSYLVTCVQQRSDSTNHLVAFSDNAGRTKK